MYVVSACLAGIRCRYDGDSREDPEVLRLLSEGTALPLCPEQLGGLPTPRPRAQFVGGDGEDVLRGRAKVVSEDGEDVTESFLRGAEEVLRIARLLGLREVIFKDGSPSCGVSVVWVEGREVRGVGVTSALLIRNRIAVKAVGGGYGRGGRASQGARRS